MGRGLVKTFDGEHPCQLCKAAAKGRQSEKKPLSPVKELREFKCDMLLSSALRLPAPAGTRLPVIWEAFAGAPRSERPLSPPPKAC